MPIFQDEFYLPNDDSEATLGTKWPYNQGEVLICIDVECHCFNQTAAERRAGHIGRHRRVCEVGLTILNSEDVRGTVPGDRCQNAWAKLHAFSLVIQEHAHKKTGKHQRWCKVGGVEDFLFGRPQWVKKQGFRNKFVDIIHGFTKRTEEEVQALRLSGLNLSSSDDQPSTLNDKQIVFLMFGDVNDKQWLLSLGVDLNVEFPNSVYENIQSSSIASTVGIHLSKQLPSAVDVFTYLGIRTLKMHNGGNDSVYEMQAFLAPFSMTSRQWDEIHQDQELNALPAI